ncbi:MAG TPA: pyruvate:ferredoxin (flavodoxin) oxidoreductase [Caproiciproducens sp.]|nr:pyruvate:ferredoxin (flavodoxin) oxidoreductase [Caproiciproducens sp.]
MSKRITMDGNQAAAHAAYAFTEVAAIYPITPSTPMAEVTDEWSVKGKTNLFGQRVKLVEMQSEAGAAGAMHGSLESGALTTTYTASQGLLLMIPNIYKMVGELLPGVLHVSARAVATHALSIFGDHQDVMACRQTGACMLASANAQEVMDLACVAHLSAITAKLPFIHFFDGFRTSHELRNIEAIDYEDLKQFVDWNAIREFRGRALNPAHPLVKGTAQNPDIYFQGREAQNKYFEQVPSIVRDYMQKIGQITGRCYQPFDYYGAPDAENIVVAMGSSCDAIKEIVDFLMAKGERVGLIQVRLYRPFCRQMFIDVMPKTVKRIAVLDRTKEPGAPGEPLYLDVCNTFYDWHDKPLIVGGRYGLGSKDTTPWRILAVFTNLKQEQPKNHFTIGIIDDVTNASLPDDTSFVPSDDGTVSCKFWGLGSDGTVGANKSACKIIGEHTDLNVQAYFSYDSKKSGGTTISHLRFGKNPIRSPYLVYHADYIACHNKSFLNHYDITKGLKPNGTFVINCDFTQENIGENLPAVMKRYIAQNHIQLYVIDAEKIASEIGLGNRINMIMQAAFFKLANIIPLDEAVKLLKESIEKSYGRKGRNIVEMNNTAVDRGTQSLIKIDVPSDWANAAEEPAVAENTKDEPEFVKRIQSVMARDEGDSLPVSAFNGMEDGAFPLGTTAYEKRGIAPTVPQWQIDKCIQCGRCSYVCPHATIRLFLLDENEVSRAPKNFLTKKAVGKGLESYQLRVQVSPFDCTGCGNCADICPAKGKALVMVPAEPEFITERENWEFAMSLTEKPDLVDRNTVKGSQFLRPLLEFNGACPGCGETPYIRLLTQLYGERMMIANATGCSSIWGASAPSIAYTTNANGRGPSWANSLFEDNAEYGYGMYLAVRQIRERLGELMRQAVQQGDIDESLKNAFVRWLENSNNGAECAKISEEICALLKKADLPQNSILEQIADRKDYLDKRSVWMIGGDGWAYDIGYGGVDQVLSSGDNVNIFVMDTEVYSNTGGQASKSTPAGAVAKFAYNGKLARKKNLGLMAITYGNVYVAQIAMGADLNQTVKAISEAESYDGPSLIIAYSPCISHGIKTGMATSMHEEKKAVDCGYWHLYRYDPRLKEEGKNPFQLDSKPPVQAYKDFLNGEIRYAQLLNAFPDQAEMLFDLSEQHASERFETYQRMAKQ